MKLGVAVPLAGMILGSAAFASWSSAREVAPVAAEQGGRTMLRDLAFSSQRGGATIGVGEWRRVGEQMLTAGCAGTGLITATVSMDVSGGPVDVRVVRGRASGSRVVKRTMMPAPVRFDPGPGGRNSFAYTFAGIARKPANVIVVEWRAASDRRATLEAGSLQVLNGPVPCD
jgi:hypothetical protein